MRRHRRSWSAKEKNRLVKEARQLRERGLGWAEVGHRLDVRPASLQHWIRQDRRQILPVAVEASMRPLQVPSGLAVVTPDGYRVEGLDLHSTHQLLEHLRC